MNESGPAQAMHLALCEEYPNSCWRPAPGFLSVCILDLGHEGRCGWEKDDAGVVHLDDYTCQCAQRCGCQEPVPDRDRTCRSCLAGQHRQSTAAGEYNRFLRKLHRHLEDIEVVLDDPAEHHQAARHARALTRILRGEVKSRLADPAFGSEAPEPEHTVEDAFVSQVSQQWAHLPPEAELTITNLRARAIGRLVAQHWQGVALRHTDDASKAHAAVWTAMSHALSCVIGALDGETDPVKMGVDEGPTADIIRSIVFS